LVIPQQVKANDISLVVSPPRHDIDAKPGEIIQKAVKVTNDSEFPVTLSSVVYDFLVQDDAGTPLKVKPEEAGRFMASSWFTTSDETTFTLSPNSFKILNYVLTVPEDALPGGHYAGVYFRQVEYDNSESGTTSKTTPEVGALFSLNIPGDIKYDAQIRNFQTSTRLFEYGPVDFTATIDNNSDTHISPVPSIVIKNMLGRKLEEVTINQLNIFPYTSRSVSATWSKLWGLGRYEATLKVPYGAGSIATSTIFFWIIPYRLIAAALLVLLVLLAIFISVKRHLAYRYDARDEEIENLKRKISELEEQDKS